METTGIIKKLTIVSSILVISICGYYWHRNWRLRDHYVSEYCFAYKHIHEYIHNHDIGSFDREIEKIRANMRIDGFNGEEIATAELKGINRSFVR